MKIASFYLGHGANAAFYTPESGFRIIELERYYKIRYFSLLGASDEKIINCLMDCLALAKRCWKIDNDFDLCVIGDSSNPKKSQHHLSLVNQVVVSKEYKKVHHHDAHSACAFAQSPFEEAVVISYDGGGSDGASKVSIKKRADNVTSYLGSQGEKGFENSKKFSVIQPDNTPEGIRRGKWSPSHGKVWITNMGTRYNKCAYPIAEIKNQKGDIVFDLALAGKLMGLSAYGKNIPLLRQALTDYILGNQGHLAAITSTEFDTLSYMLPYEPKIEINSLSGSGAFDLAFNAQAAFEDAFDHLAERYLRVAELKNLPIVMTGGCSLNVLVNEKLRKRFHDKMFVAPNIDDGGLAFGQICDLLMPDQPVDITYNGLPILDMDKLPQAIEDYGAIQVTPGKIAELCKQGKIIGICTGDSEVGPRALGNRSIICDPSYPQMKDILNAKVKFREYFRPFAPFIREERANEIFEISQDGRPTAEMRFMSYAPMVRPAWRDKLPAITHVDGTARLQTVTEDNHKLFNDILVEFEKLSDHGVLLNTSFNIKGLPILTRIADALHVLENTEIDYVYIEGYLFSNKAQTTN